MSLAPCIFKRHAQHTGWACLFLLLACFCQKVRAVSAYPYPITVQTASGGEARITLCGDEYLKYACTADGHSVVQTSAGWRYLCRDAAGEVVVSGFQLEPSERQSGALRSFLAATEHFLVPSVRVAQQPTMLRSCPSGPVEGCRKAAATGERRILVVLMQYPDCPLSKSVNDFNALFNQPGYHEDGAIGSVYDYYQYASYGQLQLHCDVIGPFTTSHEMAYYGGNVGMNGQDKNPYALFTEALAHANERVNLAEYDADGDGIIDNLHIIFAGHGEEAGAVSDAIWAHEMTFAPISVGNMRIDRYSCAAELRGRSGKGISRIGPHCHEIGHALGAMDYYDTDYQAGGSYTGTGNWDIMASGSWNDEGVRPANFNPYVKLYDYGWAQEEVLSEDSSRVELLPSSAQNVVFRINTPVQGEYFLLENRQQVSFDGSAPGHGMLLFHIGRSLEASKHRNAINTSFPQGCSIVCASSAYPYPTAASASFGNINSSGCPYPGTSGNTSFSQESIPAAVCQDKSDAAFAMTDISEAADGIVSFQFAVSDAITPEPFISTEGTILWEEHFDDLMLSASWQQKEAADGARWRLVKGYENGSFQKYVQLDADVGFFAADDACSRASLSHGFSGLPANGLVLSYSYRHVPGKTTTRDSLLVVLRSTDADADTVVGRTVVTSEAWTTKNVLLPGRYGSFELEFEGIVGKGASLMLDDVVLREPVDAAAKVASTVSGGALREPSAVFSLSGVRLAAPGRGLSVVRLADGSVRKVWSRR